MSTHLIWKRTFLYSIKQLDEYVDNENVSYCCHYQRIIFTSDIVTAFTK